MENDDFLIDPTNIKHEKKLGKRPNITTYETTLLTDQSKCISKKMKNFPDMNGYNKVHNYIKNLQKLQHPGIIPFLGYIPSDANGNDKNELLFQYAQNSSFYKLLQDKIQGNNSLRLDQTRIFIIIYGIAQTMKFLHNRKIVHENLTPSNVLLDENYEPKITDFNLSTLYINNNEEEKDNKITDKSDVYAFALLLLFILSDDDSIQIDDIKVDIEDDIKSSMLTNLPQIYQDELKTLLYTCLDPDPANRPSFQSICDSLDTIIPKIPEINMTRFNKYKKKITQEEGSNIENDSDLTENNYLAYDSFFDESNKEMDTILIDIEKIVSKKEETKEALRKNTRKIEEQNFIVTEKSKENIQTLSRYMEIGIPVLLEGETGTSKTLTAEIVCELYDYDLIRFNLSSETRIADLFGRYFGDENSWSGISYQDGPFFIAFKEGKIFLLDEINLASSSVLQCIEEALDSGYLSVEIPGKPLKERIKMHPNFRLIATQNPNKGSYANKRQNLGQKFYSRFQIINFPQFKENELLDIGQGLAKRFKYSNLNVISDLVSFHKKWSEMSDDIQCFTIREIAATIKAFSQNESIYDTIMTIYGARYEKKTKEKLIDFLKTNYPNLCKDSRDKNYPEFDGCYMNKSLKSVIKSVLFSLDNGRNVIITGKKGCGKTQVALWISEYYNKSIKIKENYKQYENVSFFCFCTEEIKVADLIGHQAPTGNSDGTNELIKWQDGFLTIALMLGKCAVLESLDEAPPTVTERLNGLLDKKYDKKEKYFDVPENSSCPRVKIEDSFRILGTSDIDKIQQMSQAFLNRFDIIVLENQMEEITENQFKDLISTLMNKHSANLNEEIKDIEQEQIQKYNVSDNIVNLIYEKVKDDRNISHISKICNSIIKLAFYFKKNDAITEKDIVEFTFNILFNKDHFEIPSEIQKELLNGLQSNKKNDDTNNNENNDSITGYGVNDNTDDPFFFDKSPCLLNFMAKLNAYSIIQQPLCVVGPTGVGKTSATRAFARMRKYKSKSNSGFQMHSFHSGTKVSHFFGSTTLQDGKIVFHDGTLTDALKKGLVFIADEFNLSSISVMKSLSLALDPTIGKNVFIPGVGEIINICSGFHFIACQNELGTLGRNAIPDTIESRFVEIVYPTPKEKEIEDICVSIYQENFTGKKVFKNEDETFARNTSKYIMKLNEEIKKKSNLFYISPWSLRDISKLFRRIYTQNDDNVKNISPIHHVLFYTMSVVPPKFENKVIDDVFKIIFESYHCNNDCIECYKAEPVIIKEGSNKGFIMKGKSGIKLNKYDQIKNNNLPTLLNAIFKISLSNKREPLLIMGNSGYKTFLTQLFLPGAQIIILNQETSVGQLLGSSGFMTKAEAKIFYIENICKILRNFQACKQLKKNYEEGILLEEDVYNLILEGKKGTIPASFYYALDNFYDKLFQEQEDNGVLSNTILELRPGLFLNAIFQGQSLILKDLPNLPTIVLERFNELFSGKQNITLSEDIHDTFTPPYDKELTNFNEYFRVIALGSENSSSKLSEAVLSRFTSINVSEYTLEEQIDVLKSYIENNNLKFNHDLDKLNKFATENLTNIGIHITFPQLIKIVEITSKLDQQTSTNLDQNYNLEMTLYRVLGGILESSGRKEILLKKIKDTFNTPNIYNSTNLDCSLIVDVAQNKKGVKSLISNLFINCSTAKECQLEVAYTDSFNDLLDILHMGLLIHNPVILEGPPGQGKHTAINYIAEMLNMEVTRISISQSTKVDDLFGKDSIITKPDGIRIEMRETDFIKIIKATNFDKRSLIILENINAASQAILNALVPVFNSHSTSILLPNGSTIQKGTFDIIGIFNPQISSKDKLPSSLINSSIYHIVSKPTDDEVSDIISIKFDLAKFELAKFALSKSKKFANEDINSENYIKEEQRIADDEANSFTSYYQKAKQIATSQGYSSEVFTLNDIDKYILLRKLTANVFDEKTIVQMIFAYRFSSDKMISKIIKDLELGVMKFKPFFDYNREKTHLFIKLSNDDTEQILLPLFKPPDDISKISAMESLTLPQKHCFIFAALSILANRACVIQGDTASGKSYIVYLISELVGAKLNVIQMNADYNLTMLAGQSVLNNELTSNNRKYLKKILKEIRLNKKINEYLSNPKNINVNNENSWTPKILKNLVSFIQKMIPEIRNEKYYPEIKMALIIIKRIMSPVNRFMQDTSTFINAIKNGEWVLIDGIESAPPTVAEKLSSLCGDNPELNLYEFGPEFYFSKDKIHKNFRLFITYNPNGVKESQIIDLTFLVKSMTFTLPPIDDTEANSAQVLLGSLINLRYEPTLSKQLAARFAHMHFNAKALSQSNPENFAGDKQYNGRTLKFIIQALSQLKDKKNISELICFIIESFYLKSFVNTEKANDFLSKCIKDFKDKPSDKLLDYLFLSDNDPRKRNKEVLIVLRNIQKYILGLTDSNDFKLHDFLNSCSCVTLYDLQYIANHFRITTKLIKSKSSDVKTSFLMKYCSLFSISSIFDQIVDPSSVIKKEHTFLCLNDQDLKSNESISLSLLQFDLLRYLSNKIELNENKDSQFHNLFSENSSILFENKTNLSLLSKVYDIVIKNSKESVIELYSLINQDYKSINFVMKIFPFKKFNQSSLSMLCYWLPLSKSLIKEGTRFSYTIDNHKIEFNEKSTCPFSVDLIMNEKDSFSLSKNSVIYYSGNRRRTVSYTNNENDILYYSMISALIKKPYENISNYYSRYNVVNIHLNSILSLKDLFIDQNNILVGLIWNLIYTLPEKPIKQLSNLLDTIESELLLFHFNSFKSMNLSNFNDIIELTKWAKLFDNNSKILQSIANDPDFNKNHKDTEVTINIIEDEMRYFTSAPNKLINFWSSDSLMKLYQNKLDEYYKLQEDEEKKSQELMNKRTIRNLKEQLYYQTVSEEFKQMKKDLISQLEHITKFTDEICVSAKKIVDQFIIDSSSKVIDESKISWPDISFNQTYSYNSYYKYNSENIKLFEELIWYSKIKSLLTEISKNQNVLNNIRKLSDFTEMSCPRELLLNKLLKNPESNNFNDDSALHTLNANMIVKLYNINPKFLSNPNMMYEILNKYMNRYTMSDEEYRWVYSNKHSSDILLSVPTFDIKDFIYLVINVESENKYKYGPLLKDVLSDYFLNHIKSFIQKNFSSFFDVVSAFAQEAYFLWVDKQNRVIFNNFDELEKTYDKIYIHKIYYDNDKNAINGIKKMIKIAKYLSINDKSNNSIMKLQFDDAFSLTENWIRDKKIQRFPSLIFWICKNQSCANQILEKNKKLLNENNQNYPGIPLWLICLRIVSSIDCVLFDTKSKSRISKTINYAINDQIKNYIIKIINNHDNKMNFDWINILITNIPTKLVNPSIRMIHDFYDLVSNDYYSHPSTFIDEMREEFIFNAISNATELIIKNKTDDLLSHDIMDKKFIAHFLSFPSGFIKCQIKDKIIRKRKDILTDETTIQIRNLLNDIKNLKDTISSLKVFILEEEKDKLEIAKKASEDEYQQAISSKFIKIQEYINQYNNIIALLMSYNIRRQDVDGKVKYLLDIQKNLQIYNEIFKNESFTLNLLRYSTTKEVEILVKRGYEEKLLILPNTDQTPKFHYLLPYEELVHSHSIMYSCYIYEKQRFYYIKEDYDFNHQKMQPYCNKIKQIVINHTTKSINIPKLLFGDKLLSSEEFLYLLDKMIKYLSEFDIKFIKPLENNQFTMESFNFAQTISSHINEVHKCLKVKFSDGSDTKTDIIRPKFLEIEEFLNDLSPLIDELISLTRKEILPILKDINEYKNDIKIFYGDFDIQIPNFNENPQWLPNFSSISNIESLSSPIISVSQDKRLIKSVNNLKCSIGSIIPSQITEPISINIISFINDEVKCEIQDISDSNFTNWISTKEKIKNFEPIQIFITPHPISLNEPISKIIEGKVLIKTETTEPLSLPFQLTMVIFPLQIRLTCKEYKLIDEDKILRLCTDKVESESQITLEVKNYYIHNSFIIAVDFESLDDNEVDEPKYSTDSKKQEISIKFPSVSLKAKKCKFYIKIAFSDNFVCKILCDVVIIPFSLLFEFYDFSEKAFKEYKNDRFSIIFTHELEQDHKKIQISQPYYLRLQSIYPSKKHGKIEFNLEASDSVIPEYDETLNDSFEIKENLIIPITFKRNNENLKYGEVKLFVEGIYHKSIKFEFIKRPYFPWKPFTKDAYKKSKDISRDQYQKYIKYNDEYMTKYPCESYQYDIGKWTEIKNKNEGLVNLEKSKLPYIVVSPFKYFNGNFHKINYDYGDLKVDPNNDVIYTQITITKKEKDIFNYKERDFSEHTEKTLFFKYRIYFSIFGYISEKCWFPVFDEYPNVNDIVTLPLYEHYYDAAISNIQLFKNNLIHDRNVNNVFNIITNCFYEKPAKNYPVRKTNFAIFMAFLLDVNTVDHLDTVISKMPKDIQKEFRDILTFIKKSKKINDKIKLVISHNLIVTFAKIFIAKYNEIKEHQYIIDLPLDFDKIEAKKKDLFSKYFAYNETKAQEKSEIFENCIKDNEDIMKTIKDFQVPENAKNCFLLAEEIGNIKITACESDSLGEYDFKLLGEDDKESDKLNNEMENLSLPPIRKTNVYSIKTLCEFYSSCSQGAIILPTYIRYQYNKINLNDAEIFFGKLLNIYNDIQRTSKANNKSIISSHVNYFVESFKNCVKRLKKAGIDIDYRYFTDSSYDSKQNDKQEYIIYPPVHKPNLTKTKWENKAKAKPQAPKQGSEHDPKFASTRYKTETTDLSKPNETTPILRERSSKKSRSNRNQEKVDDKLIDGNIVSAVSGGINNSVNQTRPVDSKRQKLKVDVDATKLTQVTSENVDGLLSNFNELDGINLMIQQIKRADKNQQLTFFENSECTIPEGYLYPEDVYNKPIPIKELVENCQYLIASLISKVSETNCPFHDMYSNLLIDISAFISIENKIYNFMLLTSFAYALSAVEIPFSIAVVADQKFRFVLKSFEDDLSMYILQKVFDCLFIKRFRTNIADTCNYSIENMKYTDQPRTQRSFFIFSNGIDENLVYAESWKEKILKDSNNSFGFIFTKSKQVVSENDSIITGMWDEFNKVVQSSASFAKIIYIKSDVNISTFQTVATLFKDTLYRAEKTTNNDKPNISNDIKPEFKDEFEIFTRNNFENIKEGLNFEFDEDSSFFRQYNPKFNDVPTKFEKLDDRFYRNKTNKMIKTALDESIRDEFYQFIHNIICANRFAFKPLLEFIFTPNLSTQKVLSRTGTEFDITALIFNLINPVPDPLIYLEQKGGLIRNYGISIVIDSSQSCFNPLSACHSYKTIEILFSALPLIDVPCVDVIIATDGAPIVLCSEVSSMRLLNEKSHFWVSLFKCLSNSGYDKCNLESAIHAAYDIRKLRYINPTSYMFVLTDGLYENEQKQLIKNHLITCQHNGISIFGIGIGIYPRGIIDMFPNIIFATNPNYLIHGIASFFGNQTVESYNDSIKHLTPEIPSIDEFTSVIKKLNEFIEKPIYIDLKQHLAKTPHALGIKRNVSSLKGNVTGVLRFSIQWNDVGDWDNNDLDAHCIEPSGFHIFYGQKVDKESGGNLDVDITDPKQNKPACENITWPNINKMQNGTYKFYVHQYAYRNGHSGFRAEIEFSGFSYFYDYKKTLEQGEDVHVAEVTLQDGNFSIHHKLNFY